MLNETGNNIVTLAILVIVLCMFVSSVVDRVHRRQRTITYRLPNRAKVPENAVKHFVQPPVQQAYSSIVTVRQIGDGEEHDQLTTVSYADTPTVAPLDDTELVFLALQELGTVNNQNWQAKAREKGIGRRRYDRSRNTLVDSGRVVRLKRMGADIMYTIHGVQ